MTRREDRRPEAELFGATVRRIREQRGLSQDRLCDAAGLSQRYLSALERGENSPTLTVILQLCDALAVPPSELLDDLWRRPDLSVRDRSLVTIAALAAMGDDDQLDLYLRSAIESGLTRAQIAEAFTHLGFYAGWAKATKAITAVTKSLGK